MAKSHLKVVHDLVTREHVLLTDSQILAHVEKYGASGNSMFYEKVLLIKDTKGMNEIISGNFVHGIDYHAQIALLYMKKHKLNKIEICGGGEIKKKNSKFEINGKSEQFQFMNSKILRETASIKFGNRFSLGFDYEEGRQNNFQSFTKMQLEELVLALN